jgi:hypothetical protein
LPIYDGVVTLDETDVPVNIELAGSHVRLSASGTEIGQWNSDECHIALVSDTVYAITAEDETLQFVPNQPSLFAAAVNGGGRRRSPAAEPVQRPADPEPPAVAGWEAPPPKPLTLALFYALCLATAALAVWSLTSIIL